VPSGKRLSWQAVFESPLPRSYTNFVGRWILQWIDTSHKLFAFALITLGVLATKSNRAVAVVHPLVYEQIARAGLRLLPMISFLAAALGFVVIGQTVALLTQVGAQQLIGTVMVTVVVRELGPLVTAVVVLLRVGTATVVELGMTRALGEVEALEALGVDPIHYLVVPRVLGMAIAVLALTAYLILGATFSGYLFAFLQDVPLTPGEYFRQLALALTWQDFVLLALKASAFGAILAFVTCFQGLARPLLLADVSTATTRALVASLIACVALDALFILVYLLL
jgi:phospholipid/cholesterol/gamma-HCH transport system permease protein